MKILIVDDEADARLMMSTLLKRLKVTEPDLELVGEVGDGVAAVEAIRRLRPDTRVRAWLFG